MKPISRNSFATTGLASADDRLEYWNAYNRSNLVGLQSSSLSADGLEARQTNFLLEAMHVADISGNDHIVERNPRLIRQYPKEAVFACHIVRGSAYFVQKGQCMTISAGETLIYDTRVPLIYGFPTEMHPFLVDMSADDFTERTGIRSELLPCKIGTATRTESMLNHSLRRELFDFVRSPNEQDGCLLSDHTYALLHSMMRCRDGGEVHPATSVACLLMAKDYVSQNLAESSLSPQSIADAVGISLRHLNRLFALDGESPADFIWEQRTVRAHADLINPAMKRLSIGEIAFACGFSSQAHFSRAVRARFGLSPRALRSAVDLRAD